MLQRNGDDCGIYAIIHAWYIITNMHIPKSISTQAWRLVLSVLSQGVSKAPPGCAESLLLRRNQATENVTNDVMSALRGLKSQIEDRTQLLEQLDEMHQLFTNLTTKFEEDSAIDLQDKSNILQQRRQDVESIQRMTKLLHTRNQLSATLTNERELCNTGEQDLAARQQTVEEGVKRAKETITFVSDLQHRIDILLKEDIARARQVKEFCLKSLDF